MTTPTQKTYQQSPCNRIAAIENEAQSIWHITELLSKLGSSSDAVSSSDQPDLCDDSEVTLTSATIQHVAKQIANHVSNIVEHVEGLSVK